MKKLIFFLRKRFTYFIIRIYIDIFFLLKLSLFCNTFLSKLLNPGEINIGKNCEYDDDDDYEDDYDYEDDDDDYDDGDDDDDDDYKSRFI